MRYVTVDVGTQSPFKLLGAAVLDTQSGKLTSLNLFTGAEAQAEQRRHEEAAAIKANWPQSSDAEVQKIYAEFRLDETMSVAYALHRASEIVARRRAGLPEAG